MNQHLTDEQFADALVGGDGQDYTAHLHSCKACEKELALARSAIFEFSHLSLRTAQERSATMTLPAPRGNRRPLGLPALWTAAAACLTVGGIIAVQHVEADRSSAYVATSAQAHPTRDETSIAEDNALMSAIDVELRWKPGTAVNTPAALLTSTNNSAPIKSVSE